MPIVNYGHEEDDRLWRAEVEQRLKDLECVPQTNNTVLTGGAMTVTDAAGTSRVVLGRLPDGSYGVEVNTASGLPVFETKEAGLALPRQALTLTQWNASVTVTSGTFVSAWAMTTPYATADAVQVQVYVAADAATTGEVRLSANIGAGITSAVQTIAAASGTYYEWKWTPTGLVAGTGPIVCTLDARRTSGTGNVNVYAPVQAYAATAASIGATPTGV